MNSKHLAIAFLAAGSILASGCAPQPPQPVDEVTTTYKQDMQDALSGYFTAHGLKKENAVKVLTIPWVAAKKGSEHSGHLVATGEVSPKGCPVFNVAEQWNGFTTAVRTDYQMALCP